MQVPGHAREADEYGFLVEKDIQYLLNSYIWAADSFLIRQQQKIEKLKCSENLDESCLQGLSLLDSLFKEWKDVIMPSALSRIESDISSLNIPTNGDVDEKNIAILQKQAEQQLKQHCELISNVVNRNESLKRLNERFDLCGDLKQIKHKRYEWCSEGSDEWRPIVAHLTCSDLRPGRRDYKPQRISIFVPLNQYFDIETKAGNFKKYGSRGASSSDRHRPTEMCCNTWYTAYGIEGQPPYISGFRSGAMTQYNVASPTDQLNVSTTMAEHFLRAVVVERLMRLSLEQQLTYLCQEFERLDNKPTLVIDVTNVSVLSPTVVDLPNKMMKGSTEDNILATHTAALLAFDQDSGNEHRNIFLPLHLQWAIPKDRVIRSEDNHTKCEAINHKTYFSANKSPPRSSTPPPTRSRAFSPIHSPRRCKRANAVVRRGSTSTPCQRYRRSNAVVGSPPNLSHLNESSPNRWTRKKTTTTNQTNKPQPPPQPPPQPQPQPQPQQPTQQVDEDGAKEKELRRKAVQFNEQVPEVHRCQSLVNDGDAEEEITKEIVSCRIKVSFRINVFNYIIDDVASSNWKGMLACKGNQRKQWETFLRRYGLPLDVQTGINTLITGVPRTRGVTENHNRYYSPPPRGKDRSTTKSHIRTASLPRGSWDPIISDDTYAWFDIEAARNTGSLPVERVPANIITLLSDIQRLQDMYSEGIGNLIRQQLHPASIAVRVLMLSWQLGHSILWNCKSGKDRTGVVDCELKVLAELSNQLGYVPELSTTNCLDSELIALRRQLFLKGGNMDIQKINTGIAGFKMTPLLGRLNCLLLGGESTFKMAVHGSMFATS